MVPPLDQVEVGVVFHVGAENEKRCIIEYSKTNCTTWAALTRKVAIAVHRDISPIFKEEEETPFRLIPRYRFNKISQVSDLYAKVSYSMSDVEEGSKIFYSFDDNLLLKPISEDESAHLPKKPNDHFFALETKGLRACPLLLYQPQNYYNKQSPNYFLPPSTFASSVNNFCKIRIAKGSYAYIELYVPNQITIRDLIDWLGNNYSFGYKANAIYDADFELNQDQIVAQCTSQYILLRTEPDLDEIEYTATLSTSSSTSLYIQFLTGKKMQIQILLQFSVKELKQKIQSLFDIPIHQQRLIFTGKQLEDHYTLEQYNIKQDSIILLSIPARARGGMFHPSSTCNFLLQACYPVRLYTIDDHGNEILLKSNVTANSLAELLQKAQLAFDKFEDERGFYEITPDYASNIFTSDRSGVVTSFFATPQPISPSNLEKKKKARGR
uniref:Ubiquitin-like domain-containing protein n=1 Tax=Aureoumbra lagunensis TaxID=44058 RepID=A0A7S3NLM2_9STRA|mmetsp:Transcript_19872/g.30274  ORF Transcript_19872/g.30274 Transcript_19872/m.30274 type:complete len:439 (+) Transcript_19872:60-1376(+)